MINRIEKAIAQLSYMQRVMEINCSEISDWTRRLLEQFKEIDETYKMDPLDFLALMQFKYDGLKKELELCPNTLLLQCIDLTNNMLNDVQQEIQSTENSMNPNCMEYLWRLNKLLYELEYKLTDQVRHLGELSKRFIVYLNEAQFINDTSIHDTQAQYRELCGAHSCVEKVYYSIQKLMDVSYDVDKLLKRSCTVMNNEIKF